MLGRVAGCRRCGNIHLFVWKHKIVYFLAQIGENIVTLCVLNHCIVGVKN